MTGNDLSRRFPDPDLAASLLPHAFDTRDGAHDEAHLLRVWRNVEALHPHEGGDLRLLLAATLLHDCVHVPKTSPDRARASRRAAARAEDVLRELDWTPDDIAAVAHAIEAHSFSARIAPRTTEARILQDADRLDALGFIGLARTFHVAGQGGRALYHPTDPAAAHRPLDDASFALDHFATKLLTLADTMQTDTGARLAKARTQTLIAFRDGLLAEVS